MIQTPAPADFVLKWRGDILTVTLRLEHPRRGRAAFRTNLRNAAIRRREIIAETEKGITPLAKAWSDIALEEIAPGLYKGEIVLDEVGVFSGKACFFPEGSQIPEWPEGGNTHIKVESADARGNNSIYTVFPRQFGSFREVVRRLPHIMDRMGFRIVQTLPPFPVPTTYAVMGEYGCPFAATDFLSVDPAMAEFDARTTPLDQFRELIDAVHARHGLFFVDLPANHTGWASTLQTHHPEWFNRREDGRFISPGAWGVVWEDLVELDYSNPSLRAYMADVFLFWCRNGVDGFRCDAGYMIPAETWTYIVARVREEYPDTVFMLEGLGGELSVTDRLLGESGLDWAYSEIFQTYDRNAFEWYLPGAIRRSERFGTLVHFAETHDNDRIAKQGVVFARLRVQLSALLSWQGAWGITNGVEWFCREKIDVHGRNDLYWGNPENMIDLIAKLNSILRTVPVFSGECRQKVITAGGGNTLAVVRKGPSGDAALVLANLDCTNSALIDWDRGEFPYPRAFDLVSDRNVDCAHPLALAPGQVMCLAVNAGSASAARPAQTAAEEPLFRWEYPRDIKREVVVPENQMVEVTAPRHFRVRIVDPLTGKTLFVERAVDCRVRFIAPPYLGDGTHTRELFLEIAVYSENGSQRARSKLLIPPPSAAARAKLIMDSAEVRAHPHFRTVLSNGAGAASQLRIGWGRIASQYDAVLSANPHPTCPSDRLNIWARTRCWLQREGYTRELDLKCVRRFIADPAGRAARWEFQLPCGMGKEAAFIFELALAEGENAARLKVVRGDAGENEVGGSVRLVFRPDIEWRSFHQTTKAFAGAEERFPAAIVSHGTEGFVFAPYEGSFAMSIAGGEYHHEPQWQYNVAHGEEAARGQEGAGDLFSPGWISADMLLGAVTEIVGEYRRAGAGAAHELRWDAERHSFPAAERVDETLRRSLDLFIVRRDELKTVIAGYPWFLDWGRDTFIFMRGMIAAGRIEDSLEILRAFAAFEENGTLPNIIYGKTAGNRDTADAQLWFVRCVMEIGRHTEIDPQLTATCVSIVDNYIKGTPNGIVMDAESALVFSPSHFTWMDTNYPACTPREGYPVEIQALWISALKFLGRDELASRALASVKRLFKVPDAPGYYDCLAAEAGCPAAKAVPEKTVRPNQLFLLTLGVLEDVSVLHATAQLLIPGGIRSLEAGNALYRGVYAGDEDTSRKPAYHNGTVWGWMFPQYAEALYLSGQASAETALQLLASSVDNLNSGCLCHISENADGDAPHAQKGCTAQAWSDSELLRVWLLLAEK